MGHGLLIKKHCSELTTMKRLPNASGDRRKRFDTVATSSRFPRFEIGGIVAIESAGKHNQHHAYTRTSPTYRSTSRVPGHHTPTLDRARLLADNAVHLRPDGIERGRPKRHRSGAKTSKGKTPRAYVLVDTEIVVKRKGGKVRIVLTGPGVEMTREEWRGVAGRETEESTIVIGLMGLEGGSARFAIGRSRYHQGRCLRGESP
jgi:hypothetical protein